jgi:protein-tyrosine kinase
VSIVEKAMRKRRAARGERDDEEVHDHVDGSDTKATPGADSPKEPGASAVDAPGAGPEPVEDAAPALSAYELAMQRLREAAGGQEPADETPEEGPLSPPGLDDGDDGDEAAPVLGQLDEDEDKSIGDDALADPGSLADAIGSRVASPASVPPGARRTGPEAEPQLVFDYEQLTECGLWPPEDDARRLKDQLRRIKRPLLANAFGINTERLANGNLIMVTSSLPGEGKSFTSFSLAASVAAELDRSVLLVDSDVAKPHISTSLDLKDHPGLINVLDDASLDLADVILRTSHDGMSFLPAGPVHAHATELLASERMATLVEELSGRYPDRVIIFDTPPLIPTTEAQAMAHLMGQILMVVHAAHTPQSAVLQALESLHGLPHVSCVLNKIRTSWGEEYGKYGYY